jgi:putative lipoprotein
MSRCCEAPSKVGLTPGFGAVSSPQRLSSWSARTLSRTGQLLAATVLSGFVATHGGIANADEPNTDEWWGVDKALHFGAGFGLSAAGYGIGIACWDHRLAASGLALGIGVGAAGAKESLDAAGLGSPSWKDFTWTLIGTALGIGVSLSFDAALRGPSVR